MIRLFDEQKQDVANHSSNFNGTLVIYEFSWPKDEVDGVFRIKIEFEGEKKPVNHLAYGSHEVKENKWVVPDKSPLHPGRHSFTVEKITPALRVYSKSGPIYFEVPGS